MAEVELYRIDAKPGHLPPICIYCGQPAQRQRRKIFTGSIPYLMFAGRGIPQARIPVCQRHGSYTLRLWMPVVLLGAACVSLLALLIYFQKQSGTPQWIFQLFGPMFLVTFLLLNIAYIAVFYLDIRCSYLTRETMVLKKVAPEFASAYYHSIESHDRVVDAEIADW